MRLHPTTPTVEKLPARPMLVATKLLPVFLVTLSATPVVHVEASSTASTATISLKSASSKSTALETPVLLKLVSALEHILMRHSLVEVTLLMLVEGLLTVKIVRSTSGPRIPLASSVFKILKLFLAGWTRSSVLAASRLVS